MVTFFYFANFANHSAGLSTVKKEGIFIVSKI